MYVCLLVASYYFYAYADVRMLAVLLLATVLTWIGGKIIKKKPKFFGYFLQLI